MSKMSKMFESDKKDPNFIPVHTNCQWVIAQTRGDEERVVFINESKEKAQKEYRRIKSAFPKNKYEVAQIISYSCGYDFTNKKR